MAEHFVIGHCESEPVLLVPIPRAGDQLSELIDDLTSAVSARCPVDEEISARLLEHGERSSLRAGDMYHGMRLRTRL